MSFKSYVDMLVELVETGSTTSWRVGKDEASYTYENRRPVFKFIDSNKVVDLREAINHLDLKPVDPQYSYQKKYHERGKWVGSKEELVLRIYDAWINRNISASEIRRVKLKELYARVESRLDDLIKTSQEITGLLEEISELKREGDSDAND